MEQSKIYINAAMEITALFMLLVLLLSCSLGKKRSSTRRSVIVWCIDLIGLFVAQIIQWIGPSLFGDLVEGTFWYYCYRAMFILDFTLYYCIALCHLRYFRDLLTQVSTVSEKTLHRLNLIRLGFWIWGAIMVAGFAGSMQSGAFYTIAPNGTPTYSDAYFIMTLLVAIVPLVTPILSIIFRRELGRRNTIMLLIFFFLPCSALWIDLRYGLCISYVLFAFAVLGIYILVEISQGEELEQKRAELAQQQVDMTNLRVSMMLSQIQPHFMFNILGSIEQLCRMDPKRAAEATNFFAKYLRGNLESLGSTDLEPFSEELNHIHNYIWLEQMRFEEDLVYEEDIGTSDFRVPSLAIQPLIENSVKHGLRGLETGALTVRLTTRAYDGGTEVIIADNGAGFDPEKPLHGKHVGLSNVRERIQATTGGTLRVESAPGAGTTITVRIPSEK